MILLARVLLIPILILLLAGRQSMAGELPEGVAVGDAAPNFVVKNIDGRNVGLSSFQDVEGVILIFTCNHCPYSKLYEDRIIALHKEFASKGWPVLAVNPNDPAVEPEDSFENMQKRAKEKEFPFPYAMDETQVVAKAYGARRTPHVFLLKKEKAGFRVAYIGAIDDNARDAKAVSTRYTANAIEAIRAGSPVEPAFTKAIGCTIKWREE